MDNTHKAFVKNQESEPERSSEDWWPLTSETLSFPIYSFTPTEGVHGKSGIFMHARIHKDYLTDAVS